jgi:small subunit ribosomal protein S5
VKGGRRFRFNALIAVGDGEGYVGVGMGKAGEVPEAVRKGIEKAIKNVMCVPLKGTTVPYSVEASYNASTVIIKPAPPGSGLVAGGPVRIILELAGVKDATTKVLGSHNVFNVTRATLKCLKELQIAEKAAILRGKKKIEEKKEETESGTI